MKIYWIAFCCLMTMVQDVGTHHTWILCIAVQMSSSLAHRYPLVQLIHTGGLTKVKNMFAMGASMNISSAHLQTIEIKPY